MKSVSLSHVGLVRADNQDSVINLRDVKGTYFFGVADGMGGHKAGDVASRTLAAGLEKYFKSCDKSTCLSDTALLSEQIKELNKKILSMASANPDYEGMGTTLTLCVTNGSQGVVYHVGDSRAYLLNDKGIYKITKDHSLVQFMLDTKQITEQEAENHPSRNVILAAVGTDENLEVDVYEFDIVKGQKVLICSDGLSDNFTDGEMDEIVKKASNIKEAAVELVNEANKRGGSDNISVVLFEA